MISIKELIPVLQVAIGPVILISGVGLLLLSMTNRLSRVIERARNLLSFSETIGGPSKERTEYCFNAHTLVKIPKWGVDDLMSAYFLDTLNKVIWVDRIHIPIFFFCRTAAPFDANWV